ncbi:MAG: amidohydrolase family protein [Longimicrobiales bacterium]|nr:amidohydrolase family protein [Longimicrobiales bacterium]
MSSMTNRRRLAPALAVVAVSLLGATALEAQVTIPAPPQTQPIAIRGATVHTVTDGVIENGTILFENGVISAVGADVSIPSGARTIDGAGKHVYPGLIDAYSEVGIAEIGAVDVSNDQRELGDFNPNARPNIAVNPESRHIGTSRTNGVLVTLTTPSGGLIPGLSSAMNMEGWTWEEMTLEAAAALNVSWPDPEPRRFFRFFGNDDEDQPEYEDQIRRLTEEFEQARAYAGARDAGDLDAMDPRYDAMVPAVRGEMPVIIDADGITQIQDAVVWGEGQGLDIVIRGGRDAIHVADELASRDIPVILTSTMDAPDRAWEAYDEAYTRAARLHERGVRIAISGGSSAPYTNRLPYEAGVAQAFGLSEEEAIRAVTLNPARFLGIADRVGSLEPGKDATLLITTGNPLDYLTDVEQAYIQGREIDMRDIHRFFFEKYMERLEQGRRVVSQ